ncbi:MAG: choice-of-anchor Q domain-containing protein [Flavobacteriales bacterium]
MTGGSLSGNDVDGGAGTPNPGNGGGLHVTTASTVVFNSVTIANNAAGQEGGGVWNNTGSTMTIDGCTIDGNTANAGSNAGNDQGGGGVFENGGSTIIQNGTVITNNLAPINAGNGGGIMAVAGSVNILGGLIASNSCARAGGGIENNNATVTISSAVVGGALVADGNTAGINGGGIHVSGIGTTNVNGGTFQNNVAGQEGGGLWNASGIMTIDATLIESNTANAASNANNDQGGGGVFNIGGTLIIQNGAMITNNVAMMNLGNGGGVMTDGGTVTITGSTISSNSCARAGGGIENFGGMVTITGGTVGGAVAGDGNTAGVNGGGIHVSGTGTTNVNGGTFANNVAGQEGGGLWNASGTMTIDGTTVDSNTANAGNNAGNDQGGGGVFNIGGTLIIQNGAMITNNTAPINTGNGGGVMTDGGSVTISGSILSGNSCARAGGGIENFNGTVTITSSTVGGAAVADGNTAGVNGGGIHVSGTGTTNVNGGTFANNVAGQEGGGLWNASGSMTIDGTTVDSNTANAGNNAGNDQGGGGVFNIGGTLIIQNGAMITNNTAPINTGNGGGVMTDGGSVTISGSMLSGNSCARAGGAIENFNGSASLTDITLMGNNAGINGGGVHVSGTGTTSFITSTASGNTAVNEGGGLWASNAGAMTITRSTVSGNNALDGGGLFLQGGGPGTGTLDVNYSTVSGNTATNDGGGVSVEGGTATLLASTIANNSADNNGGGVNVMVGTLNSNSSIIADNSITGAGTGPDANGAFVSAMFTLLEDGTGASGISDGVNGNVVGTDPGLGALADNGGITQTQAIASTSSAAYNTGDPALLENDQRNLPLFGTRDIGAFEFQGAVMGNNMLSLAFDLDAFGSEVTFQVTPAGGGAPVASGGPFADVPGGSMEIATFSVADGCYDLTVTDAGGNGITDGGYVLSTSDGVRLIDNTDNFTSGATSMAAVPFCVPPSANELLFTSCDKYFWKNGEYIVCNEDAAVAADYNGGGAAGADSGYDFLFFDPNGTYSYVRQRRHNVSDNFANIGSARTCHAKINNWAAVDQIPNGVQLNVRVRSVVNGVAGAYGPACRFTRDEALANCPPTKLFDVPGFPQFLSCNVTRDFVNNSANRLYARPVGGATQYRFTFTNAELVSPIVRVVPTYYVSLGWGAAIAPALTPGSTYDVTVEAFKGGVYCQAGESCTVTINTMVAGGQQNALLESANSVLALYPNPNQGTVLTVVINSLDSEIKTVSFEIMDMSGKLILSKQLLTQDGRLNNVVALDGGLASGMYLVRVTAGERIYTDRVSIQP